MARLTVADLEIERPNEDFELELEDGMTFTFQDPKTANVKMLMDFEEMSTSSQVEILIADDRWDEFASHPEVDGYLLEAIMKRYVDHFGLGTPGEGKASPRSARGTARPSKRTSPRKG